MSTQEARPRPLSLKPKQLGGSSRGKFGLMR
jgi:hypothetical protein